MPRTQIEKLWLLGGCLVGVLLVVIGYFFLIGPQRSQTSSVNGLVANAKSQNATLQSRIDALQQQSKNLPKYEADLAQARLALPSTSGLPDFLRTLQSTGNQTLANVSNLSVGQPSDVTKIAVTPPRPVASTSSSTSSGSSSSGSSGSSSSSGSGTSVGGTRVYALPISATITGTPEQITAFLTQLQRVQPRAVLISAITLTTDQTKSAGGGTAPASLQVTMQAFVAPSSAAESAALSQAAAK